MQFMKKTPVEPSERQLGKGKWALLIITLLPMLAVGVFGGIGSFHNLTNAYGSGTATGAVAAGEGATVVLALLYVVTTLLGQVAPLAIRLGLYVLPAAASVMAATAAQGAGQTIVYALTPMAITASSEGVAYLVRRTVIHRDGRDVEAEAHAAKVVRQLAFHQARAAGHPDAKVQARSVKKSWKLAGKVGAGDIQLGTALLDVQRTRLVGGADFALERMFMPGGAAPAAELTAPSATTAPALPAASTDDATSPRTHDASILAETCGYPAQTAPEQAEGPSNDRPALALVRAEKGKKPSISADVRQMVKDGVSDVRHVVDAIATRHGRSAEDPTLRQTVGRYYRQAKADVQSEDRTTTGQYL